MLSSVTVIAKASLHFLSGAIILDFFQEVKPFSDICHFLFFQRPVILQISSYNASEAAGSSPPMTKMAWFFRCSTTSVLHFA